MDFKIEKGTQWYGPWWKRLAYNLPPLTTDTELAWDCVVDMSRTPIGTSIKLCGTWEFWAANRNKRQHWSHFTHEDSDRFVVAHTQKGLRVSAYGYRDAVGGVTGSGRYHKTLGFVEHGDPFSVHLLVLETESTYALRQNGQSVGVANFDRNPDNLMRPTYRRLLPNWRGWAGAHASGNHGPVAPDDIYLSITRK